MSNPLPPVADIPPNSASKLTVQIGVATLSRFLLNTARRFIYPFAPVFSRALGVPLTSVTSLIAINQVTGVLSLFFGPLSDYWGYRVMMLIGLTMLATGMLAGGFLPTYGVILIALFLAGLGKSIFDPALYAYVGAQVPFKRRGLVVGIIEISWAASSLIGIPLMALLIAKFSWRTPFFVLGGLGLLALLVLSLLLPKDKHQIKTTPFVTKIGQAWQQLIQKKITLGALAFSFFFGMANDTLFVVYGAWLEADFALNTVSLGVATMVIGFAELAGEGTTAWLSDRLGLKKAVIGGISLSIIAYCLLPLLKGKLYLALIGLFLIFITVEFTIVASVSFFTEILPEARATMMSGYLAAASLGRVAGALLGGLVWSTGGLIATASVSAIITIFSLISLIWGVMAWQK